MRFVSAGICLKLYVVMLCIKLSPYSEVLKF